MFYAGNFGSATKAEIELMMFSIFMDAMIEKYHTTDGTLDYNECSDYKMGAMLGIPQEKIRTLKVKKQARYPIQFDWRNSLKAMQNDIVYDEVKKEIRNFIEEKGGYIEIQRGNNLLQMRPEYFFLLLYKASDSEDKKRKFEMNLQRN